MPEYLSCVKHYSRIRINRLESYAQVGSTWHRIIFVVLAPGLFFVVLNTSKHASGPRKELQAARRGKTVSLWYHLAYCAFVLSMLDRMCCSVAVLFGWPDAARWDPAFLDR